MSRLKKKKPFIDNPMKGFITLSRGATISASGTHTLP
jgi:hypothetical protein